MTYTAWQVKEEVAADAVLASASSISAMSPRGPADERLSKAPSATKGQQLLLTSKGVVSLYIMQREPSLRTTFSELYDLLKDIQAGATWPITADGSWLEYALDKGYCEQFR